MRRLLFILSFTALAASNAFATELLRYDSATENLRFRGAVKPEESLPLIHKGIAAQEPEFCPVEEDTINEDDVFSSSFGWLWTCFEEGDFNKYFSDLSRLSDRGDPKALYLMGIVFEEGRGRASRDFGRSLKYYTRATAGAYEDGDTSLYHLSSIALERCIDRADPSKGS